MGCIFLNKGNFLFKNPTHQISDSFLKGVRVSVSLIVAFFIISFAQGLLAFCNGLTFFESFLMMSCIFAAPTQNYLMDNMDMPLWLCAFNILLMNFKFFLMSAVLLAKWPLHQKTKGLSLSLITSGTYLLSLSYEKQEKPWTFFLGLGLSVYCISLISNALGYLTADYCVSFRTFLEIISHMVIPLHFICIIVKRQDDLVMIIASCFSIFCCFFINNFIDKKFNILSWILISSCFLLYEIFRSKQLGLNSKDPLDQIV